MSYKDNSGFSKEFFSLLLIASLFGFVYLGQQVYENSDHINFSAVTQTATVSNSVFDDIFCFFSGVFGFPCEDDIVYVPAETVPLVENNNLPPETPTLVPTYFSEDNDTVVQNVTNEYITNPVERETIREVIIRNEQVSSSNFITRTEYERQVDAIMRSIENVDTSGGGTSGISDINSESIEDLEDVAVMTKVAGDLLTWTGSTWSNIATSSLGISGGGAVDSVNSQTGAVVLDTDDISEGTNQYFTTARARDTLSSSAVGLSYATSTGVFSLTAGYTIPLTASTTEWSTAFIWGDHATASYLTGVAWGDITGTLSSQTDLQLALDAKLSTTTAASTYYLQSNPAGYTTNTGTVTSVGLTLPIGLSVAGSPITTSGTLAVTLTSGYVIPLSASTTEWQTAFGWGDHATAGYTSLSSNNTWTGTNTFATTTLGSTTVSSLIVSGASTSTFVGDISIAGSIIPTADITYDLGSPSRQWKDVYIGPGSLYINGKKVIEDVSDTITFSTDDDQNLVTETSGIGSATLRAVGTGNVSVTTVDGNVGINSTTGNINIGTTGSGSLNFGTISSGVWNGAAIDISSYTNLGVTGTGLSLSGDNIALTAGYTIPLTASTTEWDSKLSDISGLITAGSNVTITGSGTTGSPYSISSVGTDGVASSSVAFSVHKNGTNQTVTANTFTLLTWSTEYFDANNNFDLTTERFTPTVAGKYIVTLAAFCSDSTASCQASIYKNGALYLKDVNRTSSDTGSLITTIVDMNGTTDYIEAYVYNGGGTTISGLSSATNFSGALIAPSNGLAGGWSNDTTQSYLADYTDLVAIGTTTAAAKLDVWGTGSSDIFAVSSSTGSRLLTVSSAGNLGLSASSYLNWGTTLGTSGYGIRDNAGTLEYKNSGGAWAGIGTGSGGTTGSSSVAFSVHKNGTNQTISNAVTSLITWSTEVFDTNNNFDLSTERFTPTISGKYMVRLSGYCSDSTSYAAVLISKNGSTVAASSQTDAGGVDQTSAIVDMNGSTDYLEAYVNCDGVTLNGEASYTSFSGALIAPSNGLAGGWSNDTTQSYLADYTDLVAIGTTTAAAKLDVWGSAGSTDILGISSSTGTRLLTVTSAGNLGLGTTTPSALLTAQGTGNLLSLFDTTGNSIFNIASATTSTSTLATNLAITGNLSLSGSLYDSTSSAGTSGMVLQSTGSGTTWVATSTLGFAAAGGGSTGSSSVAFSVHKNGTNQTVTAGAYVAMDWTTETFDTNNNFDLTTERFTPTVAGKYLVTGSAYCSASNTYCNVVVYKNGSSVAQNIAVGTSNLTGNVNAVIDMNGSTDYLEMYVQSGTDTTISGLTRFTYFQGALIAPSNGLAGGWSNDETQSYLADYTDLVAIGTTTAAAKLDVWGSAGSTDILGISSSTGTRLLTLNSSGNLGLSASSYLTWGSTLGESGYGIRDNAGTLEFKHSGGDWAELGTGGGTTGSSSVAFSVNKNGTNQTVSGFSPVLVTWAAEDFDTNNNFDLSTERFTPTVAGKYLLTFRLGGEATTCSAGNGIVVGLRKNGTVVATQTVYGNGGSQSGYPIVTGIVDANGTSDYFDVSAWESCSSDYVVSGVVSSTNFSGALIAPSNGLAGGWSNDTTQSYLADYTDLVAIGTTTAAAKLDVWGSAGSTDILGISSSTGSRLLTLTSAGNFGLGTSTPSSKLSIVGTAGSDDIFTISSSTGSRLLTVTAAGNVGIGTTSPQELLSIFGGTSYVNIGQSESAAYSGISFNGTGVAVSTNNYSIIGDGISTYLNRPTGGILGFRENNINQMVIQSGGNVIVGAASFVAGNANIELNAAGYIQTSRNSTAGVGQIVFSNPNGTIGSITTDGSATAFNTTSDRRMKGNIDYTTLGLDDLMQLPVRDFSFLADEAGEMTTGFIAQELYAIFPWAVTENGDNGIDPLTGSSTPWSVDYGRITPLLAKSIQDLNLKLEDLASSTTATSTLNIYGDEESTFVGRFFARLVEWFADATNGIGTMMASVFQASDMICVDDECLTADDIRQLKDKSNLTPTVVNVIEADDSNDDDDGADAGDGGDVTPPATVVSGCTDEVATNYNLDATEDDGSCEYAEGGEPPVAPVLGCTDAEALNYNADATEDDGSCEYEVVGGGEAPAPIEGCTDSGADNYDDTATEDDGSCEYPEPEPEVTEPETPPAPEESEDVEEVPTA